MSRDEILAVVSEGADLWHDGISRGEKGSMQADWPTDDEMQCLMEDVERLCRERAVGWVEELPAPDNDPPEQPW